LLWTDVSDQFHDLPALPSRKGPILQEINWTPRVLSRGCGRVKTLYRLQSIEGRLILYGYSTENEIASHSLFLFY